MATNKSAYKRLNKTLRSLTSQQKLSLNQYLMSGEGPLPENANVDTILAYLVTKRPEEVGELVQQAEKYANTAADTAPSRDVDSEMVLNLSIKLTGDLDPKSIIVISRDITDSAADRLVLQEVNVDSGTFLPVDPDRVAGILKDYANTIVARQEEINSNDQ